MPKNADVYLALVLIVVVAFLAWLSNDALSNLVAGLLIGLALYCLIRLSRR